MPCFLREIDKKKGPGFYAGPPFLGVDLVEYVDDVLVDIVVSHRGEVRAGELKHRLELVGGQHVECRAVGSDPEVVGLRLEEFTDDDVVVRGDHDGYSFQEGFSP